MGTRSAIGFVEYDGSVTAIYCHFDGYPEHNGRILEEHYDSIEKVEDLLDLGDISVLGSNIGEKIDFNDYSAYGNQCVAYGRDRGESTVGAKQFRDTAEFLQEYCNSGCEYFYLFDGNEWVVADRIGDRSGEFRQLGLVLSA
jgi:uncharacterized protein YutD